MIKVEQLRRVINETVFSFLADMKKQKPTTKAIKEEAAKPAPIRDIVSGGDSF